MARSPEVLAFWQRILRTVGAKPTQENITYLEGWAHLENTAAVNNPLATTQPTATSYDLPGNAALNNNIPVQQYRTSADGADATAKTIMNGHYPTILAALRSGTPYSYQAAHMAEINKNLMTWSGNGYNGISRQPPGQLHITDNVGGTTPVTAGVPASSGETWNHKGVIRGVVEAFYDPLGSWDLQSRPNDPWGGAIGEHDKHVHVSDEDPESMIYLISVAQRMGMSVRENPYVEVVDGNHKPNTYHHRNFEGLYNGKTLGMAIDVNGTPAQLAAFYTFVTKKGKGNTLPGKIPAIKYSDGASAGRWSAGTMPTTDRVEAPFMEMVLRGMGAPVTESNMRFLTGWATVVNATALNNPLASDDNSPSYAYPEDGVKATVTALLNQKALTRLLRGGQAARWVHANRPVYEELNQWSGQGRGKKTASTYTNAIENKMRNVDPYANLPTITKGDYPNMATPENTPATGDVPPGDRNDRTYPEIDPGMLSGENSDVPGWTPNVIRPGMLYDRSYSDQTYSAMLTDVWAQVSSDESVSKESQRFARMYGV